MPKTGDDFIGKNELWKGIREKCLECCGGGTREVEFCTSPDCPLYVLRFGRRPKVADYAYAPGDEVHTSLSMKAIHESKRAGLASKG